MADVDPTTPAGHEGTARTADGTMLRTVRWPVVDAEPWASVLIVHGLAEHAGRYAHVAAWLNAAGVDVHAYDQRGFGGSAGRRADVDRWSAFHDDLAERLVAVRASIGARPLALYGHSMGGLIVAGYLLNDGARPLPDAAVLSAPAIDTGAPGWKLALARVLAAVVPRLLVANGLPAGGLSRDPEVERRYYADPLVHPRSTCRLGAALFAEAARVRQSLAAGASLPVPAFVFHGGDDPVVPLRASEPLERLPGVTRVLHAGLRHETHNEPEGEQVVGVLAAWLRATLGPATSGASSPVPGPGPAAGA